MHEVRKSTLRDSNTTIDLSCWWQISATCRPARNETYSLAYDFSWRITSCRQWFSSNHTNFSRRGTQGQRIWHLYTHRCATRVRHRQFETAACQLVSHVLVYRLVIPYMCVIDTLVIDESTPWAPKWHVLIDAKFVCLPIGRYTHISTYIRNFDRDVVPPTANDDCGCNWPF